MIGLLALTNAENYGAVLQSLALCKFINDNFEKAEIIDYTPTFMIGRYKWFHFGGDTPQKMLANFIDSLYVFPLILIKKMRFYMFKKKNLVMSRQKYKKNIGSDSYEMYIVGSDQIWNLKLTQKDENFFLPFVKDDKKKYSYAASIGVDSLSQEEKEIFIKYIGGFSAVSVREKTGKYLLENLRKDLEVKIHIDPIFLLDSNEWVKYESPKKVKGKYVLIYTFVEFNKALEIARETENDIYSIFDRYKGKLKDVTALPAVGPAEFISLIKNAEYIVTDSFHGMAFSILFNKQFTVIKYKETSSRMEDLLTELKLDSRIYSNYHNPMEIIDYKNVNKIIYEKRMDSYDFLREIISDAYSYNAN